MRSPSHNLDEIQVLNSVKLHTSPILVHNVEISFTYNLDEVQNLNSVKLHPLLLLLLLQNNVNLSILIIPIFTNASPS